MVRGEKWGVMEERAAQKTGARARRSRRACARPRISESRLRLSKKCNGSRTTVTFQTVFYNMALAALTVLGLGAAVDPHWARLPMRTAAQRARGLIGGEGCQVIRALEVSTDPAFMLCV